VTTPQGPSQPFDSQQGQAAAQYPPPQPTDTGDDFILSSLVAALIAGWALSKVLKILQQAQDTEPDAIRFLFAQLVFVRVLNLNDLAATSTPLANQRRQNAFRRAAYILAATRRISSAFRQAAGAGPDEHGRYTGKTPGQTILDAWQRETGYLRQHLDASRKRNLAAQQVFGVWARSGRPALLGWRARMDSHTTAECAQANGRNFDPSRIPGIGLPGTVHPNCRCRAVRAYRTDLRVEDLTGSRNWFDGVVAATPSSWQAVAVHHT
jgi:hypothetical protein